MCLDLKSDIGKGVKKLDGHLSLTDKRTDKHRSLLYRFSLNPKPKVFMVPLYQVLLTESEACLG